MKDRRNKNPTGHEITEDAADWFLRIQEGFSQTEFREWRRWLAEDEGHAVAFDAISKFWQESDLIDDLPWPSDQELSIDTYDGQSALPITKKSTRRIPRRRRGKWILLAAAASIAAISMLGSLLLQDRGYETSSYQTAIAEHRTIALPDGSSITLGAKSDVIVAYAADVRRLELRSGEAYFKVAKDSSRPFIVAAGSKTVRALGTEFDINIGVRDIKVSVVEGLVRVEGLAPTPGNNVTHSLVPLVSNLVPGDVLDFNAAGSVGIVREVDPMVTTSWLGGRLAYVGMSLESVIADVNRYSKTKIVFGDESTKQLIFTGTIFSNDIDNWLEGIEKVFPIQLVPVEGHGILLIKSER